MSVESQSKSRNFLAEDVQEPWNWDLYAEPYRTFRCLLKNHQIKHQVWLDSLPGRDVMSGFFCNRVVVS